jgi:hypothetical protein
MRRATRILALVVLGTVGFVVLATILLIIANARDPYGGPIEPAG